MTGRNGDDAIHHASAFPEQTSLSAGATGQASAHAGAGSHYAVKLRPGGYRLGDVGLLLALIASGLLAEGAEGVHRASSGRHHS